MKKDYVIKELKDKYRALCMEKASFDYVDRSLQELHDKIAWIEDYLGIEECWKRDRWFYSLIGEIMVCILVLVTSMWIFGWIFKGLEFWF